MCVESKPHLMAEFFHIDGTKEPYSLAGNGP